MGTPQFVDISAFQPAAIDWQTYKAWSALGDGIARVSLRSSYGSGYKDAHYSEYRAGAEAAGIQIIHYHYSYPALNNPAQEADWQHQVVGAIGPNDLVMLDFEEQVPAATADWAYRWLARQMANYGGRLPTIYASDAYVRSRLQDGRLAAFPLTLANWQYTPSERPACPPPWQHYAYLQYSDKASVPGIPGLVDADIYMAIGGQTAPIMQTYTTQSADFGTWFTATDASHWACKQTGKTVQFGIKGFYATLSYDGQSLPLIGLPLTNEIYLAASGPVLQVFERAILYYATDGSGNHQPGLHQCWLAQISDLGAMTHVPGLTLPPAHSVDLSNVLAAAKALEATATTIVSSLEALA